MAEIRTKEQERDHLKKLISEWNASRLDIFEISEPNEVSVDESCSVFASLFETRTMLWLTGFDNVLL